MTDFNKIIDRKGSHCVKWDLCKEVFGREDILPMWVADLDFETPDFIRQALIKRLEHPIYGYTFPAESYWQAIIDWQKRQHGWDINKEALAYIPGIVKGIGMVELCFTQPGDGIVIQPPVYHPFRLVSQNNRREVLNNPLVWDGDQYRMNFVQLEELFQKGNVRVLILSNPHNPGGIIWDRETLCTLAALCDRYHVIVVSDEIHADMALFGHQHLPFAKASAQAASLAITFGAPSKTFNIAGIVSSFAIVENPVLREKFFGFLKANELSDATFMATIATEAAFNQGDAWRKEMLSYVEDNILWLEKALPKCLPGVRILRPQASFLVWLDVSQLHQYGIQDIPQFFIDAGVGLNDGAMFGPGGEDHMRLNVGCPRALLEKALDRLSNHFALL